MYLEELKIENIASISKLHLKKEDLFTDKFPNIICLVGENGSGKSIVLSYIVDALINFRNITYNSISEVEKNKLFRYSTHEDLKYYENHKSCNLEFENNIYYMNIAFNNQKIFEKEYRNKRFNNKNSYETNRLLEYTIDKTELKKEIESSIQLYYPANRFETPNWLNLENIKKKNKLTQKKIVNELNRDLIINNSIKDIEKWLLNVIFDSIAFEKGESNKYNSNIVLLVNSLLSIMLKTKINNLEYANIAINNRKNRSILIEIKKENFEKKQLYVYNIRALSTGEILTLSLFINIIKDFDAFHSDENIKIDFESLKGIVLIDEIDSHLHIKYQKDILPELIETFPNIQFIITTHSPFFLLGLEEKLKNRLKIIKLPETENIAIDNYSEFKDAYNSITKQNLSNEEINTQISKMKTSEKDTILYTEGKTDVIHITKAWSVLNPNTDIPFEVFSLDGADKLRQFLISYSDSQIDKTIIGLLDYDEAGMKVINQLNKNFTEVNKNIFKREDKKAYALLLPTPDEDFKNYENCPIEFLYKKELLEQYSFLKKLPLNKINNLSYVKKDDNLTLNKKDLESKTELYFYGLNETKISKNSFAEKIKNSENEKKVFKNFKLLFEAIENILNNEKNR